MARQRRLLLVHTGWATVVDPRGRDGTERSGLGAIGPEGRSRIEPVRDVAAVADAGGSLADRLVSAGLAVPEGARTGIAAAIRQVRLAAAVALAPGALARPAPAQADMPARLVALWFALPFALTLSCPAIARIEIHPYAHWASPAGQRLLSALVRRSRGGDDHAYLTSVAVQGVQGVRAIGEPDVRAAFAHREPHPHASHRHD